MLVFSALLPIIVVIVAMAVFHLSAQTAGAIGATLALTIALVLFNLGDATHASLSSTQVVTGIFAESAFTTLSIIWIILPALSIYYWQKDTGGMEVIRDSLVNLAPNHALAMVVIAWFFSLFMEGAAGFGTPVAVAAPLLLSFGLSPIQAVVAVLFGHAMGVSFGAIGTPIIAMAGSISGSVNGIAQWAGILHALLGWILFIFTIHAMQLRSLISLQQSIVAYLCFGIPYLLISYFIGPELPTIGAALLGLVIFLVVSKNKSMEQNSKPLDKEHLLKALSPYIILIVLVLLTRLIPDLKAALSGLSFEWEYHQFFSGKFAYILHPGTLIMAAFIVGALMSKFSLSPIFQAVGEALKQVIKVAVALLLMLILARTMVHGGLIHVLADYASSTAGVFWPLFAPFLGALGSFVTGSATASNILFADFQANIAGTMSFSTALILGVQAFGSAIGNIICPHNIIAGCATVGIAGKEGKILRKTVVCCLVYCLAGGILAMLATLIFTN